MNWLYSLDVTKAYQMEMSTYILKETMYLVLKCVTPVFLVSAILGILSQIGQVGIIYSPEVLQLKFDRINPTQGFKRLFSKKSIRFARLVEEIFLDPTYYL